MTSFPAWRGRRLRRTAALRALVRENRLTPERLILPLFVTEGEAVRAPIVSMPGVARTSVDEAVVDAEEAAKLGLGGGYPVRHPGPQGCGGERRVGRRRSRPTRRALDQGGLAGAQCPHGRLPV